MKMTTIRAIRTAQTEEDLLDLISGVIVVDLHSLLVDFLKSNPEQFYVDYRLPFNLETKGRLMEIARRLVELRSAIPTNNLELVKSLLLSLTDKELSSLVSISTKERSYYNTTHNPANGGEVHVTIACRLDGRLALSSEIIQDF